MDKLLRNKILYYLLKPFMIYGAYVGAFVDEENQIAYTNYILEFPFGIKIFEKNVHGYPSTDIIDKQYLYVGRKDTKELMEMYI